MNGLGEATRSRRALSIRRRSPDRPGEGWCSAAGLAALDVYEALSEKIGSWAAAAAVVVLGPVLMVLVFVGPLLYLARLCRVVGGC